MRTGQAKKEAGGGAGKGGTAKARGGKEEAVGQQRQTLARADLECTRGGGGGFGRYPRPAVTRALAAFSFCWCRLVVGWNKPNK